MRSFNIFYLYLMVIFTSLSTSCNLAWANPQKNHSNKQFIVIRDTEIESIIKSWVTPVLEAAGLGSNSVKIIIVQNPNVNAFVAGGANIFIYTGLIDMTDSPGELIGVIAHEIGHITGGHLIKTRDAMERASYESIIGAILGIGAAIATGDGSAAPAISLGGSSMAMTRLLAHSRVQEASADQAALTFLEKAKINPSGILSFMEKLKSQSLMPTDRQSEYVQTHPLIQNRIDAVKARIAKSAFKQKPYPKKWLKQHALIRAKLLGFIHPEQVSWAYDDKDKSIPAQYARAIAAYRNDLIDKSLNLIDGLLAKEPDNPYFLELKGQMLVDYGRGGQALPYYRKAVSILPKAPLLRVELAHTMIEASYADPDNKKILKEAIDNLERALQDEPRSAKAHRLLATAYGRMGNENMAKIHLAEEAILQRKFSYAEELANSVLNLSAKKSKEWVLAKDVLSFIKSNRGI